MAVGNFVFLLLCKIYTKWIFFHCKIVKYITVNYYSWLSLVLFCVYLCSISLFSHNNYKKNTENEIDFSTILKAICSGTINVPGSIVPFIPKHFFKCNSFKPFLEHIFLRNSIEFTFFEHFHLCNGFRNCFLIS